MTTSYDSPCGFINCNPIQGQCLGFCESEGYGLGMPVQFSGPEPLDSYFDFPEAESEAKEERSSMRGLALAIVLSAVSVAVMTFFVVVFLRT